MIFRHTRPQSPLPLGEGQGEGIVLAEQGRFRKSGGPPLYGNAKIDLF
jgi:hypothetical protein